MKGKQSDKSLYFRIRTLSRYTPFYRSSTMPSKSSVPPDPSDDQIFASFTEVDFEECERVVNNHRNKVNEEERVAASSTTAAIPVKIENLAPHGEEEVPAEFNGGLTFLARCVRPPTSRYSQ